MEWLILSVLSAIVAKLVEMAMDVLLDRWRKRQHRPLIAAQVRRRHLIRFCVAAASCALYAWIALVLFDTALASGNAVSGAISALIAVGSVLFARSARRRWKRYCETSRSATIINKP